MSDTPTTKSGRLAIWLLEKYAAVAMFLPILLLLTACDRIHKVQVYQDNATKKCLESHTVEHCRPLSYPACDGNGCHN